MSVYHYILTLQSAVGSVMKTATIHGLIPVGAKEGRDSVLARLREEAVKFHNDASLQTGSILYFSLERNELP